MEMTAGNGATNMNATGVAGSQTGSLHVNMNVGPTVTQLQQRAAAAAQYLNSGGQRQPTSRDVQLMLEKNDAAMRAWDYLHAQQPSKHLISEHKAWAHKCSALRQQIGARLEVLASLADKQIAREDASASASDKASVSSSSAGPKVPPTPPPAASASGAATASTAAAKKPSRAKATKPKISATAPAPIQVRQSTASIPVSVGPSLANAASSSIVKPTATAAALGFPDAPMPVSGLPGATQNSVNPTSSSYYGATNVPNPTAMYPPATIASASTGASTASNSTTNTTSAQAFSSAPNYGNTTGYMGGMGQQASAQANPYMNNTNFMMNNAMNIAAAGMMNSQYMAMQMQNQMPTAMNTGAMYNPNTFSSTGAGYMGMNTAAQMQGANPFIAPFQMQQGGTTGYNPAFNMGNNSAQMMNQMGGFQPMQSPQMMFNPMAFNMTPAQQPQQQQQFQPSHMQSTGFNSTLPSQQQHQLSNQQQSSQQAASSASQPQNNDVASSSFLDDDSNIFDGFSDDSFLIME